MINNLICLIIIIIIWRTLKRCNYQIIKIPKSLIFIVTFVFVIFLNRYSIIAFLVLNVLDVPIIECFQKSFQMSNDITFLIGLFEEILEKYQCSLPDGLLEPIYDMVNDTYGKYGLFMDLLEIVLYCI